MPDLIPSEKATDAYWSLPATELLANLHASPQGLTSEEAHTRLATAAKARPHQSKSSTLTLLLSQFSSPIILILLFAVILSFFLHDTVNAFIILSIILVSGLLGFKQERSAADAVAKLLAIIEIKATVLRDGKPTEVSTDEIVAGDILRLKAGDLIPGDSYLLESKTLFVNEAALTGETFPVEKTAGVLPADTPLNGRTNTLFTGTYVVSGTGTALIVGTGVETEFGKVSVSLDRKPPETGFENGIRHFGYLLMKVTLVMTVSIFVVNVVLHRPVLDSFLFALALAVGLTPQLLPAIISVNLAHGAKRMAESKVIVKRLAAIENFGSMDILCSDKTGTLTKGEVELNAALSLNGEPSEKTLLYASLNASFQNGYKNPIDEAILAYCPNLLSEITDYKKFDEEPYDFVRKRLSVLVSEQKESQKESRFIVTKGALSNVLEVCTKAETATGSVVELSEVQAQIGTKFAELSGKGFRVVGVAYREAEALTRVGKADETGMTFLGFLSLFDPIKPEIVETIKTLGNLGISLKLITGDNRLVAAHVGIQAGLTNTNLLTGPELRDMSEENLRKRVDTVGIFAEIEPNQKERLILALKAAGHVVGYIGDGINDASALHVADVGISVSNAVDVAKEAADIVLLEKDLAVLERGVREGRITFANTLKYVFMATSANFSNMFSMAGASLFLPFLPLLPTQILLTNLLTDCPEMTIATDGVDPEMVDKPRRWDIGFIRRFMVVFGLVSSLADYLTFGILLLLLHATPQQFRTGWFLENVVATAFVVLVIRTRNPFYRSRPGIALLIATLVTGAVTLSLPYTPLAHTLGFVPVPPIFLWALVFVLAVYVSVAEVAKHFFYRNEDRKSLNGSGSASKA